MRVAVLLLVVLAGCVSYAPCRGGTPADGEQGVCFVSDGRILRGGVRGDEGVLALLVHGAGEDRRAYDGLSRALAANGTRVLSFDLRGHGESDPAATDDWRAMLVDLAEAEAFAERRWGSRPSVVVGSDAGSSLALQRAVDAGTAGVVLLSPGLRYKDLDVEAAAAAFDGRVLVVASARDAAGAETAAQMRDRMTSAASVQELTLPGSAHGTDLLGDAAAVERIVRFASGP